MAEPVCVQKTHFTNSFELQFTMLYLSVLGKRCLRALQNEKVLYSISKSDFL